MHSIRSGLVTWVIAACAAGCGGNDPFSVFNNDPDKVPQMSLPMATASLNTMNADTVVTEGLQFVPSATVAAIAPVEGLVVGVDLSSSAYALSVRFNSHYTVRISNLVSTNRRVGDYVTVGADIGTTTASSAVIVKLYYNGSLLCPISYFDSTALGVINTKLGTSQACQRT